MEQANRTYIALLRGINVSGQKKIKMAELRALLAGLGFERVQTYIQSGNIVLEAPARPAAELSAEIAGKIKAVYGFEVPVLALEAEELRAAAAANPFSEAAAADPRGVLLTFLAQSPDPERVEALRKQDFSPERFLLQGRCVYLHCPNGYGRARLNNNFLERQLQSPATTRNWKTVEELLRMAG